MKKLFFALIAWIFLSNLYAIDVSSIWGVWNIGEKSDAMYTAQISLGYYLRTGNFLKFDPNDDGVKTIQYDGGFYKINGIEAKGDDIILTLVYTGSAKNKNGKWEDRDILGVVAMHFVTKNEVWFEVLFNKDTDPDFTQADFRGKGTVYWRAKKVDHPVQPSGK